MTKQDAKNSSESRRRGAQPGGATQPATPRTRPLAGFLIAGASLALLFGIAALKGRVRDDVDTQ